MSTSTDADDPADRSVESSLGATIPLESASETPSIPTMVGRYRVQEVIGEGAMGVVLRAHDPQLDRVVAVKLLRGHGSQGRGETARRLRREAQALARLSHPHVVDVYDVGMVDGQVFVAMEYVAGRTLGEWIERDRPERAAVLAAFVQAGRGLAAAHDAGLVHRDFKPANVLRGDDGRVRVLDFGLAVPPQESEVGPTLGSIDGSGVDLRLTATGMVMGTPAYMAPEAWRGAQLDARGDQFGFCVALFEALYGVRPFAGSDPRELARNVAKGEFSVPSGADVPTSLRDVVLRGLSPSPEDRWPSMEALLERLQPRRRGRRWWAMVAVTVIAVGGTAGAVLLWPPASSGASCDHAEQAVAEVWNEQVRTRMHEAFDATALPYAEQAWVQASEQLDAHAAALGPARREACEAGLAASIPVEGLDRRAACLGQRLSELRGVVAVLEHADAATVRHAVPVLGGLRTLDACDEEALAAAVPPPPSAIAAEVERAYGDLAQVLAMDRAGDMEGARALVREVIERADALGYMPLAADARARSARVLENAGEYVEAEQELEAVVMLGQAAGYDAVVAEASTQLVFIVGNRLQRLEDAERWVRHARAAVDRLSDPRDAEVFLEGTLANRHWALGELQPARERFEHALQVREQRNGLRHPATITLRSNLAMVHHELGDNERARELLARVLADHIEVFGPEHPEVAATYGNLAVLEQVMGDLDASAEDGHKALSILERTVGREHPHYAQLLMNLGNTEYLRGSLERAIELQEQSKALIERSLGPRDLLVGRTLSNLGALYTEAERYDDARVALRQAREIYEERMAPGHPEIASPIDNLAHVDLREGRLEEALAGFDDVLERLEAAWGREHAELTGPLQGRAEVHAKAGRPDAAVADLRRAAAGLSGAEVLPGRLADVQLQLADALWTLGEREAAQREAEQARARVAADGVDDELRAKVDAWLAEHDRGAQGEQQ